MPTKEEKQLYLEKLLQENEINSPEFKKYLIKQSAEALDLEFISLERIIELVEEFKNQRRPQKRQKNERTNSLKELQSPQKSEVFTLSSESQKLKCSRAQRKIQSLKPTKLSKSEKLTVQVEKPIILEDINISQQQKLIFVVNTKPLKWNVKRNIGDFIWLRKCIKRLFPGHYLPVLPKIDFFQQGSNSIKFDNQNLQSFLQFVIDNEDLKFSPALNVFLEETDSQKLIDIQKVIFLIFISREVQNLKI